MAGEKDADRLTARLLADMGDIIAITNAVLVGVAGRHAIAAVVEDATHQDGGGAIEAHLSCPGVLCEQGLDSFEGRTIDDGRMLAGMGLPPVLALEGQHGSTYRTFSPRLRVEEIIADRNGFEATGRVCLPGIIFVALHESDYRFLAS
jgi:hypothetical protein